MAKYDRHLGIIQISEHKKMMSDGKMKWTIKYPNGKIYTTTKTKRQINNDALDSGYELKINKHL